MDWLDYAFILTANVVAGGIKGLTGIGFPTSCLPIMALRLDLKAAIPLVIVPSIVSNLAVMRQALFIIRGMGANPEDTGRLLHRLRQWADRIPGGPSFLISCRST
jgi:uncharacterized membrane protein YfcA